MNEVSPIDEQAEKVDAGAARARGDPEGVRLARRRAQLLSEAGRLGHALRVLLDRADFETASVEGLVKAIAEQEHAELLKSKGRVESRKRFKGGPIHQVAEEERNLLFLDESGKSGAATGEPWSYFALAGIAITSGASADYRQRADEVKARFFGRTDITFHEPGMRRHDGAFNFRGDIAQQAEFDAAIDGLVNSTDFVGFGVGVRKAAFEREFSATGLDPYLPTDVYAVAIQMLLERYVDFLAHSNSKRSLARVTFESQGPKEDADHQQDYVDILINGTQWVSDSAFRQWLETGVRFTPKQGSDPMELADMMSRDIYEWVRDGCTTWPGRWAAFSSRIYCRDDGQMGKFGVKVFPDSDIRLLIEAHRAASTPVVGGLERPAEN